MEKKPQPPKHPLTSEEIRNFNQQHPEPIKYSYSPGEGGPVDVHVIDDDGDCVTIVLPGGSSTKVSKKTFESRATRLTPPDGEDEQHDVTTAVTERDT